MAVSKVEYAGETLIDLTEDTVSAESLLQGYTAHNAAGEAVNGAAVIPDKDYYIAVSATLKGTSTVANIVLPDGAEIKDGTIVSFVTPAAGLNMMGIKIGSYTFDIVDGRNRSVLGQAGFFAKNCRISVILDLTNAKAWLQNIAMIHVGDSVVTNLGLNTNATVNDAFDAVSEKLTNVPTKASYTATLSTSWSGTSAPYTQEVEISGILATDNPHITPIYSDTNATAILEKKAWNMVGKAITSAGKITFTCFEEKPTQAISLQIEVIR